jgi:phosphoribosylglycinamide formyltransferase-1
MGRLRLGVLASGRGSNLQALIDAARDEAFPALVACALADRPGTPAERRARDAGVPTTVIDRTAFADRTAFEAAIDAALAAAGVGLVCLAGFMRVLSPAFVRRWRGRLVNIHPSLLPAFPGLDTHARVLAAGERVSGCTVHFVSEAVDAGPIILQAAVPIDPGDDAALLSARVLRAEHAAYPLAVRLIASGRARLEKDRVVVEGALPQGFLPGPGP